jgi:hypothetical protein
MAHASGKKFGIDDHIAGNHFGSVEEDWESTTTFRESPRRRLLAKSRWH